MGYDRGVNSCWGKVERRNAGFASNPMGLEKSTPHYGPRPLALLARSLQFSFLSNI